MDDLETAVRLNAAFEAAKFSTAMFSSLDDARGTVRRESPELVVLTGAVHETHVQQLAALAHDAEISTLVLLEPTDSGADRRRGIPHIASPSPVFAVTCLTAPNILPGQIGSTYRSGFGRPLIACKEHP